MIQHGFKMVSTGFNMVTTSKQGYIKFVLTMVEDVAITIYKKDDIKLHYIT
jgi:hypothetical protein